jgi:hypothetical protein
MNTTKLLLLGTLVVGSTQAMDKVRPEEMEPIKREAFLACKSVEPLINLHKKTHKMRDLLKVISAYSKCFQLFHISPDDASRINDTILLETENRPGSFLDPIYKESDREDVAKILDEMAHEAHNESEHLQSKTVVVRGYKFDPRENIIALIRKI